jgi:hypothetical protein
MCSVFRNTCENSIFRRLLVLNVSGNLPAKYTFSSMSQCFQYPEIHVKIQYFAGYYCNLLADLFSIPKDIWKCDMSPATGAESLQELPQNVDMQYYVPIFSVFSNTCKNSMFRWLLVLKVSGNLPRKYTCSIMSQGLQYSEIHGKLNISPDVTANYELICLVVRNTCENSIFRQLLVLKVSGNYPGMYRCSITKNVFCITKYMWKFNISPAVTVEILA